MSDFLNWRTDPYLLDDEPVVENTWLTANKLIEKHAGSRIFLQPEILNLYSFMIRKIDFQSGKRLLQRLPYITLPNALATRIRKNSLLLAERCHRSVSTLQIFSCINTK
ncbi:MAG: hypothetical protein GPJ52_04365 [Candidatus Heimdallarchaeota archaeon]|nr:hypothetical protein [Candidatus Heimdallarchaeota archaeon]